MKIKIERMAKRKEVLNSITYAVTKKYDLEYTDIEDIDVDEIEMFIRGLVREDVDRMILDYITEYGKYGYDPVVYDEFAAEDIIGDVKTWVNTAVYRIFPQGV